MYKGIFKKAIFTYKSEIVSLLFPLVFFVLMVIEYFYNVNFLYRLSRLESSFLSNIIFLNITHNAFTFVLLTSTVPLYKWIENQGGPRKFWREQALIIAGLALFFGALLFLSFQYKVFFAIFVLINFNFAAHHAMSQTFGLSLIYTKDLPRDELFYRAEKVERFLFSAFLFLNLFCGTVFLAFLYKLVSFSQAQLQLFVKISIITNLILAIGLVFQPYFFFKKDYLGKSFFNLRYLFWPVTLVSSMAIFATTAIHGVEYALVTRKMIKNDSLRKPRLALYFIAIVVLFAMVRIDSFERMRGQESVAPWIIIITSLSVAFSFIHYYLDRRLFKMRHQLNRETVGMLLFNNPDDQKGLNAKHRN